MEGMKNGFLYGLIGAASFVVADRLPLLWSWVRERRATRCELCGEPIKRRVGVKPKAERWHYFDNPICAKKYIDWRQKEAG